MVKKKTCDKPIIPDNVDNDGEETVLDELNPGMISPSLIEYLDRIESRKIYLWGDVCKENILNVIFQIHMLEAKGDEDIELIINSDGGYVVDCFALIDVMDSSSCDFKVTVLGMAASAACLIASNGTPGKRYAGKNAEFMFHEVMATGQQIRSSDLQYIKEETDRPQKKFNKIFSRNTGQAVKTIEKIFYGRKQDRYMTASEAKTFGIIDRIIPQKRRPDVKVKGKNQEEKE
jgi:ATP-dependent Clp protease protease subunit